jgi:hypothetical protein
MSRLLILGAWLLLLALILLFPSLGPTPDAGENQVRNTIRLALLFALPALVLFPWLDGGPLEDAARLLWSLAWLTYFIHVAMAFHHAHHWSHAEAVAHVESRSGFGQGIWFSHLFTLLGAVDVAWWWLAPQSRRRRPTWMTWALFGYLGFMTFNATVVYEEGLVRAGGLTMFFLIGLSGAGRFFFAGPSSPATT